MALKNRKNQPDLLNSSLIQHKMFATLNGAQEMPNDANGIAEPSAQHAFRMSARLSAVIEKEYDNKPRTDHAASHCKRASRI